MERKKRQGLASAFPGSFRAPNHIREFFGAACTCTSLAQKIGHSIQEDFQQDAATAPHVYVPEVSTFDQGATPGRRHWRVLEVRRCSRVVGLQYIALSSMRRVADGVVARGAEEAEALAESVRSALGAQ